MRGEVGHRRRDHAEVDDVDAGGAYAVGERAGELGTRQSPVAADGDGVAPALAGEAAERLADPRTTSGVSVRPTMPRMS